MRHFIGGQQQLMPQVLAMVASTVNSYSRLIPGFWAPTSATWGVENRTTALRAIPGSAEVPARRVPHRRRRRQPLHRRSPRRSRAACGASRTSIEPDRRSRATPTTSAAIPGVDLPRTLWEAAQALKASQAARTLFGDAFVDHFAATREWEEREFRKHITDWELARYFEII